MYDYLPISVPKPFLLLVAVSLVIVISVRFKEIDR